MSGPLPLSSTEMRNWSDLRGIELHSYEADALLVLDAVLRHPEPPKDAE